MSDEVQRVKDRLSAVEVIGQYVQLKKAGRNYTARCPFHKERTPSFIVSPERGTYMCFGCGEKGDIFSFIEKIEGIDFKTALLQLAEKAGVELPKYKGPTFMEKEKDERLRDACEAAAAFFEEELGKREDVLKYISSRGVLEETRALWRVGYAPASWEELSAHLAAKGFSKEDIADAGLAVRSEKKPGDVFDRFRGRIMFPLFDIAGRPIAFSGRFFEKVPGGRDDGEPAKYVNSPETALFKKSRVLYGLNFARDYIRKADCILLVEGQFDVILSHQSGLRFALAASGTALTPEHLSLMGRYSKRLVLSLDADAAGIRAGLKSAQMALAAGFDVKIPKITGGKDPADLAAKDPELLKAAVRNSKPAVEFFLDVLRPGASAAPGAARDERGYKKLVEAQVLPLIAAIPSKIEQAHFVNVVARELRVPEAAVASEVAKRPPLREWEAPSSAGAHAGGGGENIFSPLEKNAAMLLVSLELSSAPLKRLTSLLGEERIAELQMKSKPQEERLQFEFEALAAARGQVEEGEIAEELLQGVELSVLEEDIRAMRGAILDAEHEHEVKAARELMGKLSLLLKRKEKLRRTKA